LPPVSRGTDAPAVRRTCYAGADEDGSVTAVVIGGSRRVTRLADEVVRRLEKIVERRLPVVGGDASGADRAVQAFFAARSYELVTVLCTGGVCRNNVGGRHADHFGGATAPPPRLPRDVISVRDCLSNEEASLSEVLVGRQARRILERGRDDRSAPAAPSM